MSATAGVTRSDGAPLGPAGSTLHLMMPAGRAGPAFLVSENFYVLKRYNESDLYALFIGHLADRIDGTGADRIVSGWAKVPDRANALSGGRRVSASSVTTCR